MIKVYYEVISNYKTNYHQSIALAKKEKNVLSNFEN
jgi:hypothetical protein